MYIYVNIFFISQHFVEEDFYAYVHERCLSSFGMRVTMALQNELKSVSVFFSDGNCVISALNNWKSFPARLHDSRGLLEGFKV